jgi:hypothetical protein
MQSADPPDLTTLQDDRAAIDSLVARFFAVFDNMSGRIPIAADFEALFIPSARIATHAGGVPQVVDPLAFVAPRITLLTSGSLVDFHEWETQSETEIVKSLGVRRSRYGKQGRMDGKPFQGNGTKYFHFAKLNHAWRIAFVSWIDDQVPDASGAT